MTFHCSVRKKYISISQNSAALDGISDVVKELKGATKSVLTAARSKRQGCLRRKSYARKLVIGDVAITAQSRLLSRLKRAIDRVIKLRSLIRVFGCRFVFFFF